MKALRNIVFLAFFIGLDLWAAPVDTAAVASSPGVIASVTVPPILERSVVFSDGGRTYLVGVTTGKVIVVDGSAPSPVPPPYNPPAPPLTGLAKQTYESVMALPLEAQNRVLGVAALSGAIDSAISESGGLGIQDAQAIINLLANNAESAQVNTLLKGFKLGEILTGAKVTTREQLLTALGEIKRGLGAIK
jgi:hypothetical protein